MDDLSHKAKTGAKWLAVGQFIQPAWEFAIGLMLARLLTPKDFGIVAMGMVFFSLAVAVSNLGIGNVIIQKKELIRKDIVTAQTIATSIGLIVCLAFNSLSSIIGEFFQEPIVGQVLAIFSINFIINGITIVPVSLLAKGMRFKTSTKIEIAASFVYGSSALTCAYLGLGLFSLVYAPILSSLFRSVAVCFAVPYMPRFGWDKLSAIGICTFGGTLTIASILNYAARNADFLIVGKFLGATSLGLYKRAYDLAVIPKEKVADTLNKVFFSFVCEIRNDNKRTKAAFLKLSKGIALITIPLLSFSFLSADQIVRLMYGEKWLGSVSAFQFMAIGGIFYSMAVPFGSVLIAYGRARTYLLIQAFYSIFLVIAVFVSLSYGIEGVALAVATTLLLFVVINLYFVKSIIFLTFRQYVSVLKMPILISLTILTFIVIYINFTDVEHYVFDLAIKATIAIVLYLGYFFIIDDELFNDIKDGIKVRYKRLVFKRH